MRSYYTPTMEIIVLQEKDLVCASLEADYDGTLDTVGYIPKNWLDGLGG